ncbi:MAG: Ku protein [Rhizobiaceae bacterium]|nr:Ku protein [Rhizobiaceae bacterium]
MASRPIWKGQIRLSLVYIPVEIFSATKSGAQISFRQIHRKSGKRIQYDKVVEGIGPVEAEDIIKGYEIGKDEYVLLTDEEIAGVKLETKKTLELVQFVDQSDIPPLYYDKPYYVVPTDDLAEDAFRVVRDALRQTKRVGLGQLAMRGKEYLVALRPCGPGLLLETLHYADEIQKTDTIFEDISNKESEDDLLAVAKELIKRKSGPFKAETFKNNYTEALKRLIAEKRKSGRQLVIEEEGEEAPKGAKSNVIDLMASLKKSLEGGTAADDEPEAAPAKKGRAAKPAAKEAAKPAAKTATAARKRKTA